MCCVLKETGATVRTNASLRRVIQRNSRRRERDAEAVQDMTGELDIFAAECDNEDDCGTCKYCSEKGFHLESFAGTWRSAVQKGRRKLLFKVLQSQSGLYQTERQEFIGIRVKALLLHRSQRA